MIKSNREYLTMGRFNNTDNNKSYYDTAQVCLNGHTINNRYHECPEINQDYCDECGQKTIYQCQNCNKEIRGKYNVPDVVVLSTGKPKPPNFCHNCGKPYPWTEKRKQAFLEMADELNELSSEEKEKLKMSLDDLIVETPKTKVAETKFKKILGKLRKESYEIVKSILTDILSETLKKSLFGK